MGGCCTKQNTKREDSAILAAKTHFNVTEIGNLHELFRKLSRSIIDDNFISKEEFHLGLFRNEKLENVFADRIFNQFDLKHDGLIDFEEFVQALSIFHPNAQQSEKALCRLYDIWETGYIEPDEVRVLILAFLDESDLILPDDIIQAIIDKTFEEADSKGDRKIDYEEWEVFVARFPTILKNMTISIFEGHYNGISKFCAEHRYKRRIQDSLKSIRHIA